MCWLVFQLRLYMQEDFSSTQKDEASGVGAYLLVIQDTLTFRGVFLTDLFLLGFLLCDYYCQYVKDCLAESDVTL